MTARTLTLAAVAWLAVTNGRREGMWLSPACLFGHHQDSLITGETA